MCTVAWEILDPILHGKSLIRLLKLPHWNPDLGSECQSVTNWRRWGPSCTGGGWFSALGSFAGVRVDHWRLIPRLDETQTHVGSS